MRVKSIRIAHFAGILLLVLSAQSVSAQCDRAFGSVQPRVSGCTFESVTTSTCYTSVGLGYGYHEVYHEQGNEFGQIAYSHTSGDGPEHQDWLMSIGGPRSCITASGTFFVFDYEKNTTELDGTATGWGELTQCDDYGRRT